MGSEPAESVEKRTFARTIGMAGMRSL
jgi:hypothetical protein